MKNLKTPTEAVAKWPLPKPLAVPTQKDLKVRQSVVKGRIKALKKERRAALELVELFDRALEREQARAKDLEDLVW